jgi:hypothetical protein
MARCGRRQQAVAAPVKPERDSRKKLREVNKHDIILSLKNPPRQVRVAVRCQLFQRGAAKLVAALAHEEAGIRHAPKRTGPKTHLATYQCSSNSEIGSCVARKGTVVCSPCAVGPPPTRRPSLSTFNAPPPPPHTSKMSLVSTFESANFTGRLLLLRSMGRFY